MKIGAGCSGESIPEEVLQGPAPGEGGIQPGEAEADVAGMGGATWARRRHQRSAGSPQRWPLTRGRRPSCCSSDARPPSSAARPPSTNRFPAACGPGVQSCRTAASRVPAPGELSNWESRRQRGLVQQQALLVGNALVPRSLCKEAPTNGLLVEGPRPGPPLPPHPGRQARGERASLAPKPR